MIFAIIGWSGSILYLAAQILLALFSLPQRKYVIINAFAAILVSIYSFSLFSLQPIIINISWSALSIFSLLLRQSETGGNGKALNVFTAIWIILSGVILLITVNLNIVTNLYTLISWISVWLYLASYTLFIFFKFPLPGFLFIGLLAAILLIPQLWLDRNFPAVFIQLLWSITCMLGIIRKQRGSSL